MKFKLKLKIICDSNIFRVIMSIFIIICLALVIILPSILNARPSWSVMAFNRDSSSGTREAFAEKVLDNDSFSPGFNAREVRNNDAMINAVASNGPSVGYVSFGTIAEFENDKPVLKKEFSDKHPNIDFASFESQNENGEWEKYEPTLNNIKSSNYPSRNFNSFFRVRNGEDESTILNFDYDYWKNQNTDVSYIDTNNNNLKGSYLFYSWMNYSTKAGEIIEEDGEISTDLADMGGRIDFTKSTIENYTNDVNLEKGSHISVEIVGSTSATSVVTSLTKYFQEAISPWFDYNFVIATNGSGDAFKEAVPGATDAYIGLQSREASEDELKSWGWTENSNSYNAFAIDAILIIYNTNNTNYDERPTTNSEILNELYTNNKHVYYGYGDIFNVEH
ncbi:MAG: hypothetical protein TYPL_3090 [Candidatus Tyloplasma litorale]|nr:MAG: hypothetical protein TYPL_3090 [Mycoplasmatales bacterium]